MSQFDSSFGTFTWSPAVRALCILVLGSVLSGQEGQDEEAFILSGNTGSPAASLDYALSKQPTWLLEMFGTDAQGLSILRRLLIRRNPERKRNGPVELALNPRAFSSKNISIFLNNQLVKEPTVISAMLSKLKEQLEFTAKRNKAAVAPVPNYNDELVAGLQKLLDTSVLNLQISQSFFDQSNHYRHYNKKIFQSLVDNRTDHFSKLSNKGLDQVVDELLRDLSRRPSSRRRRFICTNTTVETLGPASWHEQHSLRKLAEGTRRILANEQHTECWRLFVLRDSSAMTKGMALAHFHATLEDNRAIGVNTAICSTSALGEEIDYHYSDCYCVPGETTFISVTPSYLLSKFEVAQSGHKLVVNHYSNFLDEMILRSTDKNYEGAFIWTGGSLTLMKERLLQLANRPETTNARVTAA